MGELVNLAEQDERQMRVVSLPFSPAGAQSLPTDGCNWTTDW